ncbi:MAG: deoxyguanosinetriphosphate triphosphohydrolase, partial [Kiloniellales bacterium]|nr:deoxyguanosinetriphosphate triphosphohydrolase [Kiloniellales bacterium]
RAGLFRLADLRELPLLDRILRELTSSYPNLEPRRAIHETTRRMIGEMAGGLVAETRKRLESASPKTALEAQSADAPLVGFPQNLSNDIRVLRTFLFEKMYRHKRVVDIMSQAKEVVHSLFAQYFAFPERLSDEWRDAAVSSDGAERARIVADYIAGMTDRYAIREYEKFFNIKVFEE